MTRRQNRLEHMNGWDREIMMNGDAKGIRTSMSTSYFGVFPFGQGRQLVKERTFLFYRELYPTSR